MTIARLKEFLVQPWFISLLIWIILIAFIPPIFKRYRISYAGRQYVYSKTKFYYEDLDGDGNSEQISIDLNDVKQTKVIISHADKVLEEYDLPGHPSGERYLYSGDYNNDKYKECYIVTDSNDSIFLNIIDPFKSKKIIVKKRFIESWKSAEYSADKPSYRPIGLLKGNVKMTKDFFFYINAGYILYPRKVYRYTIDNDSLVKSPESGAAIIECTVSDVNKDSLPELVLSVASTGNHDGDFPYTDRNAWLMVLDHNLKFLFPPVKFGKNPSDIYALPFKGIAETSISVFYDYFGSDTVSSSFSIYDLKGNIRYEKPAGIYERRISKIFLNPDEKKGSLFFLKNNNSQITELDSMFRVLNSRHFPPVKTGEPMARIDADLDGRMDYIFWGIDSKSVIIVPDNFKHSAVWNSEEYLETPMISSFLRKGEKPLLYLQFKTSGIFLKYESNPLYYLRYPLYATLYILLLLFIVLLNRIQVYRLRMKQKTEQEMTALQMKAIRNQIDPHFTLNVLNAIGSLYASETDRNRADYIFGKYAKMIRQTVVTSDQIIVSLAEELDFVRNYLDIERFRCGDSFDYSVNAGEEKYYDIRVPRMLILTFVENAVKHGIRSRNNTGDIKINISRNKRSLTVIVENSGPGPDTLIADNKTTGKGLIILDQLIELYFRLQKVKITYRLGNLYGDNNTVRGTSAVITIPF